MKKVGCAGILVSDIFCGPMQKLPDEGQLLAVEALPTKAGGCAANVAIDLTKQNIPVEVTGCLGRDPSARVLVASLEENGVSCSRIVSSNDFPTSKTVILLVAGQDRRYIHSFGANAAFTVEDIDRDWVRNLGVFYLGGLFLMPAFDPETFLDLLHFCHANQVITVVDVVIPQNLILPQAMRQLLSAIDYFLPNVDEAHRITGLPDPMDQLRTMIEWGANTVMITCGNKGVFAGKGHQFWQAGIFPSETQVDPSGSGDAFAAGVVTGIVQGWGLPETILYASALGMSAIRAIGTTDGVFTASQAEEFLRKNELAIRTGFL